MSKTIVVLFSGLPCSGKTSLIKSIAKLFKGHNLSETLLNEKTFNENKFSETDNRSTLENNYNFWLNADVFPVIFDDLIPEWSVPIYQSVPSDIEGESIRENGFDQDINGYKHSRDNLLESTIKKALERKNNIVYSATNSIDNESYPVDEEEYSTGTNKISNNIENTGNCNLTKLGSPKVDFNKPSLTFNHNNPKDYTRYPMQLEEKPNNDLYIILVEDVFLYYSMRKSWFYRCLDNDIVFYQIFVSANSIVRKERNKYRSERNIYYSNSIAQQGEKAIDNSSFKIPEKIIYSLEKKIEIPGTHKSWWEQDFTLSFDTSQSKNLELVLGKDLDDVLSRLGCKRASDLESKILNFYESIASNVVDISEINSDYLAVLSLFWVKANYYRFSEKQQKYKQFINNINNSKAKTESNNLHQLHNHLKKLVSEFMKVASIRLYSHPELQNVSTLSEVARKLKNVKDTIFQEIKSDHTMFTKGLVDAIFNDYYNYPRKHYFRCVVRKKKVIEDKSETEVITSANCLVRDFDSAIKHFQNSYDSEFRTKFLKSIKEEELVYPGYDKNSFRFFKLFNNLDHIKFNNQLEFQIFLHCCRVRYIPDELKSQLKCNGLESLSDSKRVDLNDFSRFWFSKVLDKSKHIHEPGMRAINSYIQSFQNGSQSEFFNRFFSAAMNGSVFGIIKNTYQKLAEILTKNSD
ncbi:hypothetical protein BB560_003182 [Smittium megazygosporum]|uniref:Uncharacterized protein n=1 Tax=Smittium megazygosporum TaxID=133381 RepID=A0A2T9ZCS3_9FUNG|nr:hypothetical protein BB560_003182 [Smittium megazygosporum]